MPPSRGSDRKVTTFSSLPTSHRLFFSSKLRNIKKTLLPSSRHADLRLS